MPKPETVQAPGNDTRRDSIKSRLVTEAAAAAILSLLFAAPPVAQSAPMGGMMMKGGMMPQTAASKRVSALVAKIKAGPNYKCCIRPTCDDCAVTMGSCPCGKHAAMGMPVCTQCKGGWEAGEGVIPGKTAADIKVMKPMGGMMMKGKKMGMAAPASAKTIVVRTCPMTGGKVIEAGAGMSRVANYEVHFCCAGCTPEFDKLPKAAQLQKIQAVLAQSWQKAEPARCHEPNTDIRPGRSHLRGRAVDGCGKVVHCWVHMLHRFVGRSRCDWKENQCGRLLRR